MYGVKKTVDEDMPLRFAIAYLGESRLKFKARRKAASATASRDSSLTDASLRLPGAGCAGVSIGSFAFHASLKYEAQLLDELPMIYTMACVQRPRAVYTVV